MQAIADIHPSHLHIVAASVVKEQIDIRQQIDALINDFETRVRARPAVGAAAHRRMSCVAVSLPRSLVSLWSDQRRSYPPELTANIQPRATTTTSIIPSQLSDLCPENFRHLLRRSIWLRLRLEKVTRILTRESCVSEVVWAAEMCSTGRCGTWCEMVAAGLRDQLELQLMMDMMFSNIHGSKWSPTRKWRDRFFAVAAMKGWDLPPVRVFVASDLSDEEDEDDGEESPLHCRLKRAGFCAQLLCQPFHPPGIQQGVFGLHEDDLPTA